jgi:pimeloyl-ACP methyl ester carboxylesterase
VSDYLLVHGGFGVGWVWDDLVARLEQAGHLAHVVDQLPSVGTDPASLGDLCADAIHVRRMLDAIDRPTVLVGHSYGGMVITELADHPNVRHSVYLTALCPKRGQSAANLLGNALPPVITRRDDGSLEVIKDFELAWKAFCPDLDRDRAHGVVSRFVLQSDSSFAGPSTAPPRTHPTTYVIAEGESDDSVAVQEATAARADFVIRLPGAHMVQISQPDELAEALGRI